jgi:two-component system, chemotaxis family, protein-glutamate methylesterase/glutaminase
MPSFVIVVGASAGGSDALCKLAAAMPRDLNAAIFIVLHLGGQGIDRFLTTRLQKCTSMHCVLATDGLTIKKGHIYIAPVDQHLILKPGTMHLTKGPTENRWRPSIDVLFRSAAVYYNERTIGIVLSGMLYDGTAGMQAIKRCGGTCIVQDPGEAMYPDMPHSVLNNTMVDHILPVAGMTDAIQYTIASKKAEGITIPEDIKAEVAIPEKTITTIDNISKLGKQTVYSCPDCGGGLWEIKDSDHIHYRCHIGHAFSENELLKTQFESINETLWVALRMMEERKNLLFKISHDEKTRNMHALSNMHTERAQELEEHITKLKELLFNTQPD